jgi:hypothetical protein
MALGARHGGTSFTTTVGLSLMGPLVFLGMMGCDHSRSTPVQPSTPPPSVAPAPVPVPPPPTSWKVSGRLLASHNRQPVSGATLLLDGIAPEPSASDGAFTLDTPEGAHRPLAIAAEGYQYRETFLRGGEVRRDVDIDLIPTGGSFPFWLYRQMARNGHEQPTNLQPLQRWTTNPNIHLENRWRDTGAPIADDILLYFMSEIQRVIPELTDGRLSAGRIDVNSEVWNFVPDYISIHFDHSGNWGYVGVNPGQVQFGTAAKCTSIMIIHELGHAMGYWHSSVQPSVMGGHVLGTCNLEHLTPDEQLVARVLYSRPPGNVEPDRDPPANVTYLRANSAPPLQNCDELFLH